MRLYKTLWLAAAVSLFLLISPLTAKAAAVDVSIPDFPVTVNGQRFDSTNSQYPMLVYKDITYFPMAYHYARFFGLKANWYATYRVNVLFVGVAGDAGGEFQAYPANAPNAARQKAAVPSYDIAVNTTWQDDFIDNAAEEYPILSFRDITYFPLTWRFCVEEFGMQYTWDSQNGLQINSSKPFRPVIDDTVLGVAGLGAGFPPRYFYSDTYYVVYPSSTYGSTDFTVRKRGGEERTFTLAGPLSDGDYTFNARIDDSGQNMYPTPVYDVEPSIDGCVFSVKCVKADQYGGHNVILKINLDTGEIVN